MKRILIMICGTLLIAGAAAKDVLVIAANRSSDYRIVLPEPGKNRNLDHYWRLAGEMLARCIRETSGAELPVVHENNAGGDRPSIYIGPVKALSRTGIDPAAFDTWEYRIEAHGRDLFLIGQDSGNRAAAKEPLNYNHYILGSLKAVTEFVEQFANTLFLFGGDTGISIQPGSEITVPANYRRRQVPAVQFNISLKREQGLWYEIANNYLMCPWMFFYGGHSHPAAVPKSLFEKHPEYFALRKGKRQKPESHPQYCLSNPEVQQRIYREAVRRLDDGYRIVQLAQSDGFIPCECKECKDLYGVEDFGEKLWIMHRKMAEQLEHDRPGKMLCIIAYGPTQTPPRTFREFPGNVMIELAPCNERTIAAWHDYRVDGGFMAYLYNWGWYQLEGFMPKLSMDFLAGQAGLFHRGNVKGLYRCGFGELFGLEGASYFQWGKQLENPEQDSAALLERYCRHAFGDGAATMMKFYRLLSERLQLDIPNREFSWYQPELLDNRTPALIETLRIIEMRYPDAVTGELEKLLAEAEKSCRTPAGQELLQMARLEFDYLKLTAAASHVFDRWRLSHAAADYQQMLQTLQDRLRFIDGLPAKNGEIAPVGPFQLFGCTKLEDIREGGRLLGRLRAPFNWDLQWYIDHKLNPVGRRLGIDDQPQMLAGISLYAMSRQAGENPTLVQCRRDRDQLTVTFLCRNVAEIPNDRFRAIFGYGGKRWQVDARPDGNNTFLECIRFNHQNRGQGDEYRKLEKSPVTVHASVSGGDTVITLSVPWSAIGLRNPRPGTKIEFNAVRLRQATTDSVIWNFNLNQKTWRNYLDESGTLIL